MRRTSFDYLRNPYAAPLQPTRLTNFSGPLRHVSHAGGLPISVAEARAQCYIENDLDDIALTNWIKAAYRWVENTIVGKRQFLPAVYDWPLQCWWEGPLKFPRPPLQAVTHVKYFDTAGTEQTLAATVYLVDSKGLSQPGTIERAPGQSWPALHDDRRLPITVRFTAGYLAPVTATVATDLLTSTGRAFNDNDLGRFWLVGNQSASAALPAGLLGDTDYWVRDASSQTFKVATVPGGTAVDITGTGTGLFYFGLIPEELRQSIRMVVAHWYRNRGDAMVKVPDQLAANVKEILDDSAWGSCA